MMVKNLTTMSSKDTQVTGNIGLFYVCYELSRRGVNVTLTLGNTIAVDLIVGSVDFKHHKSVQVKTLRKTSPAIGTTSELKTKADALKKASRSDFWVHVVLADDNSVEHVFVWEGNNEELILRNKECWLFPTQRVKYREKWEPYLNNWQLIESALK